MKKPIPLLILFFLNYQIIAQELINFGLDSEWYEGELTSNDGEKLSGIIRYNDVEGIISYRINQEDREQRSFRKSDILSLTYYDKKEGITRKYYALAFNNKETGKEEIDLYEMIKEFKDFAVLSQKSLLNKPEIAQPSELVYNSQSQFSVTPIGTLLPRSPSKIRPKHILTQDEQIYFLNVNGKLDHYMTVIYYYEDRALLRNVDSTLHNYSSISSSVLDKRIPSKYFVMHWPKVKQYVKDNRLKLYIRKDFIDVLDFYDELLTGL